MSAFPLHQAAINCMALHPASGLLATASADACIRLWALPDLLRCQPGRHAAAQRACLAAHGAAVTSCAFSSCGAFLASASMDGTVRLWRADSPEPLAILDLWAGSVAFAPGDDAALLVAPFSRTGAPMQLPMLLDLRSVPACRHYCAQLAAAQAPAPRAHSSCARGGRPAVPAPAIHPAAAVWLSPVARGAAAAQQERPAATAGAAQRHAGALATSASKRRRRQQEAAAAEEQAEREAGAAPGGSAWLPRGSPLSPRPASSPVTSRRLLGSWAGLQCPTSPQPQDPWCSDAAVAARYEAAAASAGSVWDAESRSFAYRQGGHAAGQPACWAAPLPSGLHVLTVAADGEAKLWPAGGGGVCCSLLPPEEDRRACELWQRCRPAVTPDGRHVVCGGPSGSVACWDLQQLQRLAHLPPDAKRGNAAAACRPHQAAVTAVALSACGCLMASGDLSGRLVVRWI